MARLLLLAAIASTVILVRHASAATPRTAGTGPAARTLLIDDDESYNNDSPGDTRLSASDTFYRTLLGNQGTAFDTLVVPRYKNGPDLAALRGYSLVVWYTGASYGGNPDNTSVISAVDERTIEQYLNETGGTLVLVSPGYLSNALGAGVDSHWSNASSGFLTRVMGVKGGRGLLGRFDGGLVTASSGASFTVARNPSVEAQFSALNPDTGTTLYSAPLNPDGQGVRPTSVATSHSVAAGRFVYVGFTLENVTPNASAAFAALLPAATTPIAVRSLGPGSASSPPPTPASAPLRTLRTVELTVTGAPPLATKTIRTIELTVTGAPALTTRTIRTPELTVIGQPLAP